MNFTRPIIFWIATLAAVVAIVILLRGVLLPFVTGMALAYLLSPVAGRMERLGISRLLATLAIMGIVVVPVVVLMVLLLPTIVREISYFAENLPLYVRKLQTLATDPSRPWLSKIIGEGLVEAEHSVSELTTLASSSLDVFLRSLWSGGEALISFFSLAVVPPIVACYLIYDWDRMIASIDHWIPPARRETVWALASEIDKTISGFVRGQSVLCLVLAAFYASTLSLIGLHHSVLIGVASGLLSFIPYLGSLSGLVISICVAIAQFWPLEAGVCGNRYLLCRAVACRLCPGAVSGRPPRPFESRVDDVCAVRLRLFVWFRRPVDCGTARRRYWCADAFCAAAVLCKPAIRWRCKN